MPTLKDYSAEIRSMFGSVVPAPGWRRPEFVVMGKRKYRGKERYVAGFGHSRMYANSMSGIVTDRILGYGDTQEEAIALMRNRLG